MSIFSLPLIFSSVICMLFSDRAASQVSTYEEVMAEERKMQLAEFNNEYLVSGGAAVVIGIYGYYNTAPNPLIKLLYAATQTAGVITIAHSLNKRHSPNLMLEIDDMMAQSQQGSIDVNQLKERIATYKLKKEEADRKTTAYTSAMLAALYFYNGYREDGSENILRNVYYFLGFNFTVVSSINFYQLYYNDDTKVSWELSVLPTPMVTYRF